MQYAITVWGAREEASPGEVGRCPTCDGKVLAKCGEIKVWHWAHKSSEDCDRWFEPETLWHRSWKSLAPPKYREVVKGPHRADIVDCTGMVIELQASSISPAEIREREQFYGNMAWIFNCMEPYAAGRLELRRRGENNYATFRWKQPRRTVFCCRKPVLLDIGEGVLLLQRFYPKAPVGGWGYLYSRAEVVKEFFSYSAEGMTSDG